MARSLTRSLPTRRQLLLCAGVAGVSLVALLGRPVLAAVVARPPEAVLVEQRVAAAGGARTLRGTVAPSSTPIRANLVGATWTGDASSIELRARGADGRWSRWVTATAASDEGPDRGSAEAAAMQGRKVLAVPVWVGFADDVQVRVPAGHAASDLRLTYVNTTGTARTVDRLSERLRASAARVLGVDPDATASPTRPAIITRQAWGADESIRRRIVTYTPSLEGAVVHHTVSANAYSRSQAAAMVRGIYAYHVRSLGWNDIGYNFLVDRYGQVFEGRYGGMTRNVVGAHTLGFNNGTTGMALLGTFSGVAPTSAQRSALVRTISWRLDLGHANPAGSMRLRSNGNDRYPEGTWVNARAVSGHRDLYPTECPGGTAYSTIDGVRAAAWAAGGAKLADPRRTVSLNPDGTVDTATFRATGNQRLSWRVTLTRRSDGAVVRQLQQTSRDLLLTWDGVTPLGVVYAWDLNWRVDASASGSTATPFAAKLTSVPPPIEITLGSLDAYYATPNDDGVTDRLGVWFELNTPGRVRVQVTDRADHSSVRRTVWTGKQSPKGRSLVGWDGLLGDGSPAPDGAYSLHLVADDPVAGRANSELWVDFAVERTLAFPAIASHLSPNGDARRDTVALRPQLADGPTNLTVVVRDGAGATVRTLLSAPTAAGPVVLSWDGRDDGAALVPDGTYRIRASIPADDGGTARVTHTVVKDTVAPSGQARRRSDGTLRILSSEPAVASALVRLADGSLVTRHVEVPAGWSTTSRFPGVRRITLTDRALNARVVQVTSA